VVVVEQALVKLAKPVDLEAVAVTVLGREELETHQTHLQMVAMVHQQPPVKATQVEQVAPNQVLMDLAGEVALELLVLLVVELKVATVATAQRLPFLEHL
jgi:hypothetical protein